MVPGYGANPVLACARERVQELHNIDEDRGREGIPSENGTTVQPRHDLSTARATVITERRLVFKSR